MVCGLFSNRRKLDSNFLARIVLDLIAGFIGSKIVKKRGEGLILDILLANRQPYRWGLALLPFRSWLPDGICTACWSL